MLHIRPLIFLTVISTNASAFIVGAKKLNWAKMPYLLKIVSSVESKKTVCSGVLVNLSSIESYTTSYALTAGHCLSPLRDQLDRSIIQVYYGPQKTSESPRLIQAHSFQLHKGFKLVGANKKLARTQSDLALIKLARPVTLQNKLIPMIVRSKQCDLKGGVEGIITGNSFAPKNFKAHELPFAFLDTDTLLLRQLKEHLGNREKTKRLTVSIDQIIDIFTQLSSASSEFVVSYYLMETKNLLNQLRHLRNRALEESHLPEEFKDKLAPRFDSISKEISNTLEGLNSSEVPYGLEFKAMGWPPRLDYLIQKRLERKNHALVLVSDQTNDSRFTLGKDSGGALLIRESDSKSWETSDQQTFVAAIASSHNLNSQDNQISVPERYSYFLDFCQNKLPLKDQLSRYHYIMPSKEELKANLR